MNEQESITPKDREAAFAGDEDTTQARDDCAAQELDPASRYWAQLKRIAA